jgi:hypothetical protein
MTCGEKHVSRCATGSSRCVLRLIPFHRLLIGSSDVVQGLGQTPAILASLLDDGAARTHGVDKYIKQHAADDIFLLTSPMADHWTKVESKSEQETVKNAIFAEGLSILADCVAWYQKGDDTQFGVIEASKQSELPVASHSQRLLYDIQNTTVFALHFEITQHA